MKTPARKIINTGTKKLTGVFPSIKNQRLIVFESLPERDVFYLQEFDQDVISYQEQPFTITYCFSNRRYRYTPDLLVVRKTKTQLIEVKPKKELSKILNDDFKKKKFDAAAKYCISNGYDEFRVITDEEVRQGNFLTNIKFLYSYARLQIPASVRLSVRNELSLAGPQQISSLLSKISSNQDEYRKYHAYILSMIYHQEIKTDLLIPIRKNSIIQL